MMGVGKSILGKNSKKLKYNFIDVDKLIEKKEGMSIDLIFKNKRKIILEIENDLTLAQLETVNSVIFR